MTPASVVMTTTVEQPHRSHWIGVELTDKACKAAAPAISGSELPALFQSVCTVNRVTQLAAFLLGDAAFGNAMDAGCYLMWVTQVAVGTDARLSTAQECARGEGVQRNQNQQRIAAYLDRRAALLEGRWLGNDRAAFLSLFDAAVTSMNASQLGNEGLWSKLTNVSQVGVCK